VTTGTKSIMRRTANDQRVRSFDMVTFFFLSDCAWPFLRATAAASKTRDVAALSSNWSSLILRCTLIGSGIKETFA
jgi:hypothetical protein